LAWAGMMAEEGIRQGSHWWPRFSLVAINGNPTNDQPSS
jgi:hypothetical protein